MVDFTADDTAELASWRREVRDFLEAELPGGMIFDYDYDEDEDRWAAYLAFWRKVGQKKWVALTWPEKYYGLGKGAIEKWILHEEFINYGAPSYPVIGMAVAGAVLRLGTHEQRMRHLKGIAEVTTLWGEGFTEPASGSDLASLTTHARLDGDHWVLNGQKTLGTAAHRCTWMNVLARTDPTSTKHAGLTAFLVPLDAPGISMTPLHNIAGGQQNHTFFDNVRVPADCLVGELHQGWNQVWFGMGGEQLDRGGSVPDTHEFRIMRTLKMIVDYCRTTKRNGKPLSVDPVVRLQLGELMMGVEVIKLHAFEGYSNAKTAGATSGGVARSYIGQAYYKEFWPRMAQTCMEIVGPMAQIHGGKWSVLEGRVQNHFRASFGNHAGGTSQLKRMSLATRGYGLPR
jgi:alkylation response protein AidB-like acyl-CoA dehydrogenase